VLNVLCDVDCVGALQLPNLGLLEPEVAPQRHEHRHGGGDGELQHDDVAGRGAVELGPGLREEHHEDEDDAAVDKVAGALLREGQHHLLAALVAQRGVALRALRGRR
jgi:hypothetical protein